MEVAACNRVADETHTSISFINLAKLIRLADWPLLCKRARAHTRTRTHTTNLTNQMQTESTSLPQLPQRRTSPLLRCVTPGLIDSSSSLEKPAAADCRQIYIIERAKWWEGFTFILYLPPLPTPPPPSAPPSPPETSLTSSSLSPTLQFFFLF